MWKGREDQPCYLLGFLEVGNSDSQIWKVQMKNNDIIFSIVMHVQVSHYCCLNYCPLRKLMSL